MSKFLSVNMMDFVKGLAITVSGAVLSSVVVILNAGRLPNITELKGIGLVAVSVGVSYILKNLFTNSNNEFAKKESNA
jgi:hypothetical protein